MENKYDVVIIGAGIAGLTCGCYLAKVGLKVLIAEQHSMPGGYCTSFQRKGYRFDSAVHYIGGVKRGSLAKILEDLELKKDLKFNQFDPTDKIILPDTQTYIRAKPYETIKEFKKSFPAEKNNIDVFFKFIMQPSVFRIQQKVMNLTLKDLLDSSFSNKNLKSSIGVLLLGNMGLPPSKIPAIVSVIFFREFLLDPGYYPIGGMQKFADSLVDKIKEYGGEVRLATKVTRIITSGKIVKGVELSPKEKIYSKIVVSASDATQTFKELVKFRCKEGKIVENLVPSNSVFAIYFGVKEGLKKFLKDSCNIWFFNTGDIEKVFKSLGKNLAQKKISGFMLNFPSLKDPTIKNLGRDTIQCFTMATIENKRFWDTNRHEICSKISDMIEKIIPCFKERVDTIITATPLTFQRYTLNRDGAAFGWASTIEQANSRIMPQKTSLKNLFLTGHWCTRGAGQGGISTVAVSGKSTAQKIIQLLK